MKEAQEEDDDEKIMFHDEPVNLTDFEVLDDPFKKNDEILLDNVEVLG